MAGGPFASADPPWQQAAVETFGERLPLAQRFAELLSTTGIERGLLGPREAERIWDRHLLNCAAVTALLPSGSRVVDVGSGAGLPGLALAVRRPDLQVVLVESLQRRCEFLIEAVRLLDLAESVRVVRGRAEDRAVLESAGCAPYVTARAVAPLDRLVRWCLPLLVPGGQLLAMKGRSAADELALHRETIRRLGGRDLRVLDCVVPGTNEPVLVVNVTRAVPSGKKGSS